VPVCSADSIDITASSIATGRRDDLMKQASSHAIDQRRGKTSKRLPTLGISLVALVGTMVIGQVQGAGASEGDSSRATAGQGAAFAMSNVTAGNRIVRYRRSADGSLTRVGSIATRGLGQGTDLDTTGGLLLSDDHRYLYAANAGSDDLSVFSVRGTRLRFLQRVPAGDQPNSLTEHGDLLYALNGSVAGNGIRGFRVSGDGRLRPIAGSVRLLSSPIAVPGQVQFSPDGRTLLVTQKTTNESLSPERAIDAFRVEGDGRPSATPNRDASHGIRPFSLAFRRDGKLVVAESFDATPNMSAVSSYRLSSSGALSTISGSVRNRQTDTCWIVVTRDGRYVFTANFGSGTISSYAYDASGRVRLINGRAAILGDASQPVDLALSNDSRYLYLLLRGTGGVAAFGVQPDGSLRPLGTAVGGLPVSDGASGLAVY